MHPAGDPSRSEEALPVETPAFVCDLQTVSRAAAHARALALASGCTLLYSVKALALKELLSFIHPLVDGFSTSSVFECMLSRDIAGRQGLVHFTAPGFRPADFEPIVAAADRITFNSLSQWAQYRDRVGDRAECGLRINPELSYVRDPRYAPCLPSSKLGVTLPDLEEALSSPVERMAGLSGLHVHCNCESRDLGQLAGTVEWLADHASSLLERCRWVNLGGGYLFEGAGNIDRFVDAAGRLRSRYGIEVCLEPGAGLVQDCARLEASVLDVFEAGGEQVAVLDASVNHLPNVFSYQEPPIVLNARPEGRFRYTLAGPTCLAGDVFGRYAFETPLRIGRRISFPGVGAYTLAKSHMFNGVALPTVYLRRREGDLERVRRYGFADFASIYAGAPPTGS